ncbi:MAG: hypothetical protein JXB26_18470 [Candidatus Aminicenantes bacterium]|nr:hypothetical protein [Candidatus Aminicenantes bacterium]
MKNMNPFSIVLCILVVLCAVSFLTADMPIQWNQAVFNGFGMNLWDINCLITFEGHLYAAAVEVSTGQCYIWRSENGYDWENIDIGSMGSAAIKTMGVFDGYLYAGIGKSTGAEIWRSGDGLNWDLIIDDGFDTSNINIYSMAELDGDFYVGTWGNGGGQIWRSPDGLFWQKVNTNGFGNGSNVAITALMEFDGYLYAGTNKWTDGCEVWRSADGTSWARVVANGFGNSDYNDSLVDFEEFDGSIFAAVMTFINGFEIWKSQDGINWVETASPGFGDPVNTSATYTWCDLQEHTGALYASTSLSRDVSDGGQVWRSFDGSTWDRISDYGFGNSSNVKLFRSEVFDDYLYVGTHNHNTGCEIWTNKPPVIDVDVDIKPGSTQNSINPRSKGKIPVAILTTEDFQANTVDVNEVRFGKTGIEAAPVHYALKDVDGDGDLDLILHFKTQETGIQCGDTQAFLTGRTIDGKFIEGSDSVRTVGCK